MSRLYIFGPLVGILLGVVLSFIRLPRLAWLPVVVAVVLVVSLVGAMWKALRGGGRTGEAAMLALAVPGLNVVTPLHYIARWPRAVHEALPNREDGPSGLLFSGSALLYAASAALTLVYAVTDDEVVGTLAGAVGLVFFVLWLAASREAVAAIEELDVALGGGAPDPRAAEWTREREAVRAALLTGGGAERAWAVDVIVRHARRGETEAGQWAAAMASEDPAALPTALASSPARD